MRGRKPKKDAVRRGGVQPDAPSAMIIEPAPAIDKPPAVAINPLMSACWDSLVGCATEFEPCDVPLLESYCYWYAVLKGAMEGTMSLDGSVATTISAYDEEGNPDPSTTKPNPDLRTAEKATTMLRQLGDALNISPTARVRSGLMRAMTASTVAGLVQQTDEGFARFLEMQERRALPDAAE